MIESTQHARGIGAAIKWAWSSQHWRRTVSSGVIAALVAGCAVGTPGQRAAAPDKPQLPSAYAQLPLVPGWFEGKRAHYITTDASDMEAAKAAGANYVPRLEHAIPDGPKFPGQRSSVEPIYAVTNFKQDSILPSIPMPTGHESKDRAYSPLWQVHRVTWVAGSTPRLLRSHEEVLDAEEKGQVTIAPTRIVKNCPVIFSDNGGLLQGVKLIGDVR